METARGERRGVVILDADQAREAAGDLLAAADEIERLERLDEDEMADD